MNSAKMIFLPVALLMSALLHANAQAVPKKSLTMIERGQEKAEVNPIKLYPNPASTSVKITFSRPLKGFSLQVFNQAGETVLERNNWKREALDVSQLQPGMYIVRFTKGKESYAQKFVVEK
ncbi:T9SS type A sorting domain-containing protein [Dyadobacter sp. LJ53]|uniref:T9SS type A sorting domain-containing protein n=1 Tax=Dyadobacter chenwenxiniae TaxID=2906456 RepID=UPI001F1D05C9|nr:T9SS type A sorting domain-containing protein [Dyadobacter chenwenxiniae]MCF0052957.1 T9SS type A sorting domain-containing protein [Dyadobacter chenwenxiniae]